MTIGVLGLNESNAMGNIVSSLTTAVHDRFVSDRRTRHLARQIARTLTQNSKVLDIGCGDGTIDALLQQERPDLAIQGVDVLLRPATKIPVRLFDGEKLPFAEKEFDTVMFIDVLHHTVDPFVLLREATRLARKSIVLKDHTMDGPLAFARLRFMDWVGNSPHGVALPYNYWPEQRWRNAFLTLGLKVVYWQSRLGLYPLPLSLVFDARLHFLAVAAVEADG